MRSTAQRKSHLPQHVLLLLLLLLGNLLLQLSTHLHGLSGLPVGNVQGLGHLGELLVDMHLLQATSISCQSLVQWHCVSLCVLPVGDARWDLPLLLLLDGDFPGRRMKNRSWRRRRTSWDLFVDLETGWFHGIHLGLYHPDDALLGSGVKCVALLTGRVSDVLGRSGLFSTPHGHGCGNLCIGQFLQGLPRGLCGISNRLLVRATKLLGIF